MLGNLPHKGPGGHKRPVLFFTAQPRALQSAPYSGTQMTKEKLILKIIRVIRDTTQDKADVNVITFLYRCMAEAMKTTIMTGAFDGTMQVDQPDITDFNNRTWLMRYNAFRVSVEEFRDCRCAQKETEMEARMSDLVNYWREVTVAEWSDTLDPFMKPRSKREREGVMKKVNKEIAKEMATEKKEELAKQRAKEARTRENKTSKRKRGE